MEERSNKRYKLAAGGTTPVRPKVSKKNKETDIVHIENCVDLPNEAVLIKNIQACGHEWKVGAYIQEKDADTTKHQVVVLLMYAGKRTKANPLIVNTRFRIKSSIASSWEQNSCSTDDSRFAGGRSLQRDQVIKNALDDNGTFTFEIDIEIATATAKRPVWYPQLICSNNDIAMKLYRSIDATSDVKFLVGQAEMEIKAHKNVLFLHAAELYKLVVTEEQSSLPSRNGTKIILKNTDASALEVLVRFCYIGTAPMLDTEGNADENEAKAKSVLLAADRFGCKALKLYTESYIVENILVPSKAARLLLLADSHSCALLKEASMNAFVTDPKTAMESHDDWNNIQESTKLLEELFIHATSGRSNTQYSSVVTNGDGTVNDADGLDVTSLRERLQKYHLDVDGSKKMLLKRWKNHCGSKNP